MTQRGFKMIKALSVVYKCAPMYDLLIKRDHLFIYSVKDNAANFIEPNFQSHNFLHLTGMEYTGTADEFFAASLGQRLKYEDVSMRKSGATEVKLLVLPDLVDLPRTGRKIGFYNGTGFSLHTDVLAGNSYGCMGFVRTYDGKYVPNTVLKKDMRSICDLPLHTIVTVLSKGKDEPLYSQIHHRDPRTDIEKLQIPDHLLKKIDPIILQEFKLLPN